MGLWLFAGLPLKSYDSAGNYFLSIRTLSLYLYPTISEN